MVKQTLTNLDAEDEAARLPGGVIDPMLVHDVVWNRFFKLNSLMAKPFFARFAEAHSLHMNEWRIIMILASMKQAAAHELCEATGLHPMNVSRSLASLRDSGRVVERRDANNLRRKIITLTPAGQELYEALTPHLKKMAEYLFSSLDPAEVEAFSSVVNRLILRLDSLDLEGGALLDMDLLFKSEALAEKDVLTSARAKA